MSIFGLTVVTGGLQPDPSHKQTSLVTGGLFAITTPQPGNLDTSPSIIKAQGAVISSAIEAQGVVVNGPQGTTVQASVGIPIGHSVLSFNLNDLIQDPTSLSGRQLFNPAGIVPEEFVNNTTTYTGSDLRVIVDLVNTPTASNNRTETKQLIECTTFTISVHREKAAVRAAGYINPKGFARGKRTIAGTMVLTQFTIDILYKYLLAGNLSAHDLSKDTQFVKVDQLPPFNMTLLFADEFGNVSYRRVLGVDFVTDGVVYSTNDMLTEQTVSYMASDFTPLLDIDTSAIFYPNVTSQIFNPENTVQTVLTSNNTQRSIPATNIFSPASS